MYFLAPGVIVHPPEPSGFETRTFQQTTADVLSNDRGGLPSSRRSHHILDSPRAPVVPSKKVFGVGLKGPNTF